MSETFGKMLMTVTLLLRSECVGGNKMSHSVHGPHRPSEDQSPLHFNTMEETGPLRRVLAWQL